MCDIIWCKECATVNYLDPFNFWNWEGTINCAGCSKNYYIHMIQGHMYKGPEGKPAGKPDISPLYADKPLDGYEKYLPGVEGRTRPYRCLPREIYLGKADIRQFSIRNRPLRAWPNQPPTKKLAGSRGFSWNPEKEAPDVWKEYQEKRKRGEVKDW